MVFLPPTNLGRLLLGLIIALYISLLILNLVSFGGLQWITYTDYNVQFGLWRVCSGAVSASRTCSQWSDGQNTVDSATNTIIFTGKPGFVGAAQGLEIVSLIFYIFAGIFVIVGMLNLARVPVQYMFGAAAVLLFLCIIFLSASLGVMGDQGRRNHSNAYLDWAWWIGLLGLIITVICVIALVIFIYDMIQSNRFKLNNNMNFNRVNGYPEQQQQQWNYIPPTMMMEGIAPPPYFSYPLYNQWPPGYPPQQFNSNNQFQNPFFVSGGMNQSQFSPMLATLARQHLSNFNTGQFQQRF